jgi:hypothetical protein
MSNPRALVGGLSARLLGAVLLLAAYAKAIDPQGFAIAIREVLPMPQALALVGAVALVAFEAALGAALLSGARHRNVLVVTNATFLAFTGIVVWQLVRPGDPGACGCFGQLLERTPWQAFWEDVGFVALSGLAWLGRPAGPAAPPWRIPALVGGAFAGFAACAPWLPLDDHATALAPGARVESTRLDEIVPELRAGRHLVLLVDRADAATRARIPELNARLGLPGGPTTVWGVADDDRALATEFMWSAGPAFEVRGAPPTMLRRLYRMLPRSALIEDGRIVATWTGFPPDPALGALARGETP